MSIFPENQAQVHSCIQQELVWAILVPVREDIRRFKDGTAEPYHEDRLREFFLSTWDLVIERRCRQCVTQCGSKKKQSLRKVQDNVDKRSDAADKAILVL